MKVCRLKLYRKRSFIFNGALLLGQLLGMLQGLEMGEEGSSEVSPIVFGELESSHPFSTQCAILQSKVINAEGMQSQGLNPSVWISRTHLTHGESES